LRERSYIIWSIRQKKRALYRRLLDLRGAESIRVAADTPGLVSVTCEGGGARKLLKIKI